MRCTLILHVIRNSSPTIYRYNVDMVYTNLRTDRHKVRDSTARLTKWEREREREREKERERETCFQNRYASLLGAVSWFLHEYVIGYDVRFTKKRMLFESVINRQIVIFPMRSRLARFRWFTRRPRTWWSRNAVLETPDLSHLKTVSWRDRRDTLINILLIIIHRVYSVWRSTTMYIYTRIIT